MEDLLGYLLLMKMKMKMMMMMMMDGQKTCDAARTLEGGNGGGEGGDGFQEA